MTTPDDAIVDTDPFGPDGDNAVPGELVLVLSATANSTASQTLTTASATGGEATPTALGISSVDSILAGLQPTAIDKVHDEVGALGGAGIASEDGTGGGAGAPAEAALLDATYLVRFNPEVNPADALSRLAGDPNVVSAQQNFYASTALIPNDTEWARQWGPDRIHCPAAWDLNTGSASVTVAVVDSGVDPNHPDLAGNLLTGRNFVNVGAAPAGWQWVGRTSTSGAVDTNAADEVGHGTHVAGIIGAIGNNNQGVAGVVWQCKILPVRVMARQVRTSDGATTGRGTSADIAKGIRWAADQGAKIINLSLGHYSAADTVQANAVNYALGLGVLVVAAMGNDNTSKPMYPAALPGVFAVGAIDSSDQRWVHPTRANVGSNTGSHIQLVAPGAAIYNTYFDYPNSASTYAYLTGTSMATPHVAGVAAMLLSADPTKSAADLKSALTASARALPVTDPVQVGVGCVDCDAALRGYCPAPAATGGGTTGTTGTATDSSAQPAATDPAAQPATTDPAAQPAADPGASTDPGMVPA